MMDAVYLDNAASTPVDPRVAAHMMEWLAPERCGNPASPHALGRAAAAAVAAARAEVAALIKADVEELVWTSGATEANNIAILGGARARADRGRHVLSCRTEHKAVLEPCERLAREGFEVEFLEVDADGRLPVERVQAALRPDTVLVTLMAVNNETGVVHDLAAIAERVRATDALFHVDAAQAAGRVDLDMTAQAVDFLSLSAHKAYGPKGVGALYVRRRPRRRVEALLVGGGQEQGIRPGTLATHQVVGMGEALRLLRLEQVEDNARILALRRRFLDGVVSLGGVVLNGREDGVPHIANLGFAGVHGEALAAALPDLAVSAGSACASADQSASHVLRAMGVPEQLAYASLRFSFGRFTTEPQLALAVKRVREAVSRLRAYSPVWQSYLAGAGLSALYGQSVRGELRHVE